MQTRYFRSPRADSKRNDILVGAAYLFNPFTIISWYGRSTSNITNTAIIHAVSSAVHGNGFNCMLALALASYLSMYPVLLLPPLALICWDRYCERKRQQSSAPSLISGSEKYSGIEFGTKLIATLSAAIGVLFWASYLLMGSWDFIPATYGMHLAVPDLTPNVGVWWYFFIEIFDPFRDFFLGVFWLHIAIYVGSLTVRIRRQPLFVITTLLGVFAIFKPYPSISDVSLYFGFLPLYQHIFPCKWTLFRPNRVTRLTSWHSNALFLCFPYNRALCDSSRASFLLFVDLCRLRKRQLLLRHHLGLDPRVVDPPFRHIVCSLER